MLDFTVCKKTLEVKLPEGIINVLPPKKKQIAIVGKLTHLSEAISAMDDEAIDEMYACVADLLANNAEGKKVTAKAVENALDFAMIVEFIGEYASLMSGSVAGKN